MTVATLIFGGLGALVDCADHDLAAWNAAFRIHGLDWVWSWDVYAELLRGADNRLLADRFAAWRGEEVNAQAVSATQQKIFAAKLAQGLHLRAGVRDVLCHAARQGWHLSLVSRAESSPVRALLKATARAREGISFDAIILRGDVPAMAPAPDAMQQALALSRQSADRALAIVDTGAFAQAATAAGIRALAFPSRIAEEGEFGPDLPMAQVLTVAQITALTDPQAAAAE